MAASEPAVALIEGSRMQDMLEIPDMVLAAFEPVDDLEGRRRDDIDAIAFAEATTRKLHEAFMTTGLLGLSALSDNSASMRNLRIYSVVAFCGSTGSTFLKKVPPRSSALSLTVGEPLLEEQRVQFYRETPELEEPPPKEGKRGGRASERRAAAAAISGIVPSIKIQEDIITQPPAQVSQQSTLGFARTKAQATFTSMNKLPSSKSSRRNSFASTQQDSWQSTQPEDLTEELKSIQATLAASDGSFFASV